MIHLHPQSLPNRPAPRIFACVLVLAMLAALLMVSSTTLAEDSPENDTYGSSSTAETVDGGTESEPESEPLSPGDASSSSASSAKEANTPAVEDATTDEVDPEPDDAEAPAAAEQVGQDDDPVAGPSASSTREEEDAKLATADEGYRGGSIPILRFTFRDDLDPDTGEVVLSGDNKIENVNTSPNHVYRATGVSCDLVVPASWDNPESDLLDGVSGYKGASSLEVEFFRGRGNSTWRDAKKPYKFKLEKKADLFGMGKNKHWVLMANSYDATLSIDRIVGWIGDQMGLDYTPRGVPVDLYLNDTYYGNYLLMEEVRIDENRVEIDEVAADASDPDSAEITGGYLFGTSSKPTTTDDEKFSTSRGTPFSYVTPEYPSPLTAAQEAQQAYLKSYLDRVEEAVFGEGFVNGAGESVWDLMDQDTFASYWWIQEFSTNRDAYATPSTYLYKTRDQAGVPGTLYWGPLWDFDFVWDAMEIEGFDNTNTYEMPWPERLRSDPEFVELLKERWTKLDGILENITKDGGLIDQYIAELSTSWDANNERWNASGRDSDWDNNSCKNALNELRSHFETRRAWINAHLDDIKTTFRTITFMDGDVVVASDNKRADRGWNPDSPEMPKDKDGLLFDGWYSDSGEQYSSETNYYEDTVFRAKYIDPATVAAATGIYFPTSEIWISNPLILNYDLVPFGAKDTRIVWSSSDESVLTVDANGCVTPVEGCLDGKETAEAVVTAHLVGSGQEASVRLVVYDDQAMTLPEPESITFDKTAQVEVGEYLKLECTSEPVPNVLHWNYNLRFSVEDEDIAMVTDTGVVLGKKPGTTTVMVERYNQTTWDAETVAAIKLTVVESKGDAEYTLTFKLNGGTLNGSKNDVIIRCKNSETITIPQAPTRAGYTFDYWKGSHYEPGDKYKATGDHTFTAQWKRNKQESEATHPAKDSKSTSSSSSKGKNSSTHSASKGATPRTWDDFDPLPYIAVSGAAALAFAVAFRMRQRKE